MLAVICDMLDSFNTTTDINNVEVDTALLKSKIDELLRHVKNLRNQLNTIEGPTTADTVIRSHKRYIEMKRSEPGM